jgi:hypothetical protein
MSSPSDMPVQGPNSTPSIVPPSSQVARKRTHVSSRASSCLDSEVFSGRMRTAQLQRQVGSGAEPNTTNGMLQLDAAYVAVVRSNANSLRPLADTVSRATMRARCCRLRTNDSSL